MGGGDTVGEEPIPSSTGCQIIRWHTEAHTQLYTTDSLESFISIPAYLWHAGENQSSNTCWARFSLTVRLQATPGVTVLPKTVILDLLSQWKNVFRIFPCKHRCLSPLLYTQMSSQRNFHLHSCCIPDMNVYLLFISLAA